MSDEILNDIDSMMKKTMQKYYSKQTDYTARKRYREMSITFKKIIKMMYDKYNEQAKKYYEERTKNDDKLEKTQKIAIDEIKKCIEESECFKKNKIEYEIIPASSFSGKINLIKESDIDFGIVIKNMKKSDVICFSNALGKCGYILNDIRNTDNKKTIHWVFQKFMDGVEIEGKVRDYGGFKDILKMHEFIDNKMKKKTKIITTYTKYLLQKYNKETYSNFKMFIYCHAGYHGKSKKLLYPLT